MVHIKTQLPVEISARQKPYVPVADSDTLVTYTLDTRTGEGVPYRWTGGILYNHYYVPAATGGMRKHECSCR